MSDSSLCVACGAEATGNFCSHCGARVGGQGCGACGAELPPGAMYCAECGQSVKARERKPASAALPWILSAVVLVGFSLVIAQLVQSSSRPRTGDMLITGNLPGDEAAAAPATGSSGGMPSLEELNSMTPRQAADRLFERAMSEHSSGDYERAAFFLDMGLQAYAAVPQADIDADARFHMGLMHYFLGDTLSARLNAEDILSEEQGNLLGLVLSARVAEFRGDSESAAEYRTRLRASIDESGGDIPDRPEYESHRPLIERELEEGG